MGNDFREVYYSFIEQYEIFNRIYDEFNDEDERSSNNNDLEEIQEEECKFEWFKMYIIPQKNNSLFKNSTNFEISLITFLKYLLGNVNDKG